MATDNAAAGAVAKPSPWVLATSPTGLGEPSALVTLVDGQTFCLSDRAGDFDANPVHGVYFADMRVLSSARLRVGGSQVEVLAVQQDDPESATFIGRCPPASHPGGNLLVVRRRRVGSVWHENIEVRNYSSLPLVVPIELAVTVDFADVFAVKEGRGDPEGQHSYEARDASMLFSWRHGEINRRAELSTTGPPPIVSAGGFRWIAEIAPGETWEVDLDLAVAIGERWITRRHHHPDLPDAARRNREWMLERPTLRTTDGRLSDAYSTAIEDLSALRLHDPEGIRRPTIAAGAPWYMALFGRDALITSYMALPVDRDLALGVLDALAELQGTKVDPGTEEQPGRIVHETRYLGAERISLTGHSAYYGSVDATPLFVVLLAELLRWGLPDADLDRLLPHADRALAWIDEYGDRDGDGFVEYVRSSDHGLVNQGWKDSGDAIRYRDGTIATAPLALCEVQGYTYAAFRGRAAIARHLGDDACEQQYESRAAVLKRRFNEEFWIHDVGWPAVALDEHKQQVDSLTSNIGHCLWTGIVDDDRAAAIAERLMSPAMWTGWGIRTLAADERGFDPMSYHCGSVWPHDGALCAAGLARYGLTEPTWQVVNGLLDAAEAWHGRLPEFFCGLGRDDVATPIPMPTSCSPQAWASATPLLLLRLMTGLEPAPDGTLTVTPMPGLGHDVALSGIRCGDDVYSLAAGRGRADVTVEDPSPVR